jgi:predicted glycosyltransferase
MALRPGLLFYCQSSLGLGHLIRSWTLAESLSSAFHVVMAVGGALPHGLRPPVGVDTIALPAVAQDERGELFVVGGGHAPLADVLQARQKMLLDAYLELRPQVVVIELFPLGRRKFKEELMPLVQAARRVPRALVVSSVRDLLVDRGAEQQRHDDRAAAMLEAYFDAVLVHTDPAFSRFSETFRPSAALRVPVVHTGFVAGGRTPRVGPPIRRILVSGGGGRFAEPLYLTAIEAHRRLGPEAPPMLIVAGPLCPNAIVERLRRAAGADPRIQIDLCVADLAGEMEASAISVSQCGYNTALDILRARVPALVVPFAENGDSEQTERATRLSARGGLQMLPAGELTPAALAGAMHRTLAFRPTPLDLDLDGAACTTRTLAALVHDADARLLA